MLIPICQRYLEAGAIHTIKLRRMLKPLSESKKLGTWISRVLYLQSQVKNENLAIINGINPYSIVESKY